MNQGNMPNNQIPGGNVPNNNVPNSTVPNGTVPNNNVVASAVSITQYMQNSVPNTSTFQNNVVPPEVPAAPVPPTEEINSNSESTVHDHEVAKILSSSFESKEKVNLLTPEQKDALMKKREEAMREKESYQPEPVGKFKMFFMFFFLIALAVMTFFLPQINAFIGTLQDSDNDKKNDETITTGTLSCTKDRIDDKYNYKLTYDFNFSESKLKKLSYYEVTTGDQLVDSSNLNEKLSNCKMLKSMTAGLGGIRVNCSLSNGSLTREQVFDYTTLNTETVVSAYMEAGGEYPGEFQLNSDINAIEKNMKASDFSCERYR